MNYLREFRVERALVQRVKLDHLHEVVEARLALIQRVERRPRARPRRGARGRVGQDLQEEVTGQDPVSRILFN